LFQTFIYAFLILIIPEKFLGRNKVMKKRNYILKEAGVLLIGAFLICSSVAAMANNNEINIKKTSDLKIDTVVSSIELRASDNVLWDNWVESWTGSFAAQLEPPGTPNPLDAFPADDFMFDTDTDVHRVYYGAGYWNCNFADGPKDYHYDWNITFFEDDGSGCRPGNIFAGPFTISDEDIFKTKEAMNSTIVSNGIWGVGMYATLPEPVTFNPDTKYWITIYSIGPVFPQSGWAQHNESLGGILLHEAVFKSDYFSIPNWTNTSEQFGEPFDMMYALLGPGPDWEITISKGFGVSATITNVGVVDATNTNVTISTTGGLVLFGKSATISLGNVTIGDTATAKLMPIGIGNIAIDVEVTSDYSTRGYANESGLLILILVI
jgi:hypothetical protein